MKHYATWVDLFEILNGEFKKEMVGGGGACPSFVDNVQGPWLANAIQFVIACYLHI